MDSDPSSVDENVASALVGDDLGTGEIVQIQGSKLLESLEDDRLRAAGGDVCHEGEVLHESYSLPLGRLGGAHHSPVRVVELPGLGLLSAPRERSVAPSQVRQGTGVSEPVEDLAHSGLARVRPVSPVARGEAVLEAPRDVSGADRRLDIEVLVLVQAPLELRPDILLELPEQRPEEAAEEGPREVQPLLPEVVPVVLVAPSQPAHQQFVHRVPQEKHFPSLAPLPHANVWQHFAPEQVPSVRNTLLGYNVLGAASLAYEVESDLLLLYDEGFLETGPEEVHHLSVLEVVDHVLNN
mmetsp:Transcript_18935/g.35124  ORF Transcript_18935/g.35124 Transcript_18935/m.35124 type:complete len:296 (+) Transcript_18935:2004-2891(+)